MIYNLSNQLGGKYMTDEEQKRIFSKNLNYYISLSGKQQKEVAKELGFQVTTFNTWCKGKIIPGMGKVQKLADYFNIGKSDLLDNKLDADPSFDAKILSNTEIMELIRKYCCLSINDKMAIKQIIESLYDKGKVEF